MHSVWTEAVSISLFVKKVKQPIFASQVDYWSNSNTCRCGGERGGESREETGGRREEGGGREDGEEGEEMMGAMGATVVVMVVDLGMLWVRARLAIAARMAVGGGR